MINDKKIMGDPVMSQKFCAMTSSIPFRNQVKCIKTFELTVYSLGPAQCNCNNNYNLKKGSKCQRKILMYYLYIHPRSANSRGVY